MSALQYYNTAEIVSKHVHGRSAKKLAVLHETVSGDLAGLGDILGVENYLAKLDYGIHGMSDLEGHKAWAHGYGDAIFWQAGGVNEISIGIEQVSYIPALIEKKVLTVAQAYQHWLAREKQLHATAQILAAWHNSDRKHHLLRYVNGSGSYAGVTSHWDVSQFHKESEGHTDCHPHHKGGYYPILSVISMAQAYAKTGLHF
jgi:hypothetical protein